MAAATSAPRRDSAVRTASGSRRISLRSSIELPYFLGFLLFLCAEEDLPVAAGFLLLLLPLLAAAVVELVDAVVLAVLDVSGGIEPIA
jgi:hypothetical protein